MSEVSLATATSPQDIEAVKEIVVEYAKTLFDLGYPMVKICAAQGLPTFCARAGRSGWFCRFASAGRQYR